MLEVCIYIKVEDRILRLLNINNFGYVLMCRSDIKIDNAPTRTCKKCEVFHIGKCFWLMKNLGQNMEQRSLKQQLIKGRIIWDSSSMQNDTDVALKLIPFKVIPVIIKTWYISKQTLINVFQSLWINREYKVFKYNKLIRVMR